MNVQLDKTVNTKLQQEIQARMVAKNLSVAGLEKKAGLRMSAVRNILRGQSKRPSAEILQAIAKTLECSITDLIGENSEKSSTSTSEKKSTVRLEYPDVLVSSTQVITKLLEDKERQLSLHQVLDLIEQVYLYSSRNTQDHHIDMKFAEWTVERAI